MRVEPGERFAAAAEELFGRQMERFIEYIERDWVLKPGDDLPEDMTDADLAVWNRCCESMRGALELWLEDDS